MESTSHRFGLVAESVDGAGVRVRRYRDDDVAAVQAACDDALTQRFLPMLPSPYTHEDADWWVREGSLPAFERGGGNFAIADPATDRLVGGIGITHEQNGNGEIGYWVAPWGRRRGVAGAATRALTDYAFSAGFGRLQLRTEPANTTSQRVAIAAGYRREGVQRGAGVTRRGDRHDLIVWSRLASDPPGPAHRVLPDLPGGELTDRTVTLRPIGPADGDALRALYADPAVRASNNRTGPLEPATVARICCDAGANWLAGTRAHLAVLDAATGAFAGEIALFDVSPGGESMIGYAMAPAWRGRGFATAAARLLTRWALTDRAGQHGGSAGHGVGLARVVAGADPSNVASQRVLAKAGFTREGYQRGHLPRAGGGRADVVSYALLATDLTSSR
jgi:RimJ/RimL family protein N-acetyltransferase